MRLSLIALVCVCTACAVQSGRSAGGRGTLITLSEQATDASWSEAERSHPVAMRNLRRSPEASYHLLRLQGQRAKHVHTSSDAVLFLVAGELELELEGRTQRLSRGDVLELPRGTAYGLKNLSADASVAYVVFTPALAAEDDKTVTEGARESAWKWNLWVQ